MGAHSLLSEAGAASRLLDTLGRVEPGIDLVPWDCAYVSDTGLERAHNEDSVCLNRGAGLLVVADGMGGYNAGEVASALAIEQAGVVLGHSRTDAADDAYAATLVEQAFAAANAAILTAGSRRPECLGMGTTMVLAVVDGHRVTVGHVGDSRAYLLRAGHLSRLTHDHSVGQAMIDAGVLDEQAARASTLRGVLTRALGVEPSVDTDIKQFDWQIGDRLLLCSDGLTDMIHDTFIRSLLMSAASADEAAKALVRAALDAGGHDNVTVLAAFCHGEQGR